MDKQFAEIYEMVKEGLKAGLGPSLLPPEADRKQILELWQTVKKMKKPSRQRPPKKPV